MGEEARIKDWTKQGQAVTAGEEFHMWMPIHGNTNGGKRFPDDGDNPGSFLRPDRVSRIPQPPFVLGRPGYWTQ